MKTKLVFFTILLLLSIGVLSADSRNQGVDIFLLIDKSRSLNDYSQISQIKKWAIKNISEDILIPGDWIYIDTFCGTTDHLLSLQIQDETSIEQVKNVIKNIKADGYYTDFGTLMDTLSITLNERAKNGRKKYAFILSDMIQQAPPDSKYLSMDKNFSHAMLTFQRIIPQKHWKVVNFGINIDAKVKTVTDKCYTSIQTLANRKTGSITTPMALAQTNIP